MTAPSYATRVWWSPDGLHYEGRDGCTLGPVPLNEAARLFAYLRQAAEHGAFAQDAQRNARLEWEQAIARKGAEQRAREEERLARERQGRLRRDSRDQQRKADLKLLQELGL